MPEQALSGLRVIEFGDLVSAPYCGKLMADLGAEVIKIETPGIGDEARRRKPFAGEREGVERSGLFAYLNTNKFGITLDPKTQEGKTVFETLIREADILVENNLPKEMAALGLDYGSLEKINPRLIMTSITPFGQTGPYRDYKATELNLFHGGGHGMITTAVLEEPVPTPTKAGGRQAMFGAGLSGAVASLCGIFARENTGEGQQVDVSVQECLAGQYESAIQHWVFNENEMGGVSVPVIMPITPLPCKDGYVYLMCVQDHEYDNFVKIMGNPEWADNELFENRFTRAEYFDALVIFLAEWSEQYSKEEIFRIGQKGNVPVAPAYTPEEVVNLEHLNARAYFIDIDHPEIGRTRYPGAPYRFSETQWRIVRRAPLLGEHNEDILGGRLGYNQQDLEKMRMDGII
ncbi:MAG: CoA transferase [Proteobacteria bacterium]|nr:CoA transferase [Pseudomonadota bacterium]